VNVSDVRCAQVRESLADWLAWQETLHVREIDLGLERVRAVAERMHLCGPPCPAITVAGTNGKGSSVAMLSSCLSAAGLRVGTYTSPHILVYNERVRVDGAPVSDERLCAAFARIDAARGDIPLTYFEFGTLAALDIFAGAGLDVAVLEVGLGGRLDAVNLIDADVALVTALDIDHVEWLGPDRESIAREKAGIFRSGRPAVCSDPVAPAAIAARAGQIGARLYQLGRQYSYTPNGDRWRFVAPPDAELDLPRPRLVGEFQLQNAAGVVMALQALRPRLRIPADAIAAGLSTVALAGRFQRIAGPVEWILDVAHNPHAAASLAANLRALPPRRVHAVVGVLKDKDGPGVLAPLAPLVDVWHVGGLVGRRGAPAEVLSSVLAQLPVRGPVHAHATIDAALASARTRASAGERVIAYGSFLTVAAASRLLGADA
jgi:dihydrofolate synthase/folylpolyglutamate synthase